MWVAFAKSENNKKMFYILYEAMDIIFLFNFLNT